MDDSYPEPTGEVDSLPPEDLYAKLRAGEHVPILDVRDRDEFEEWHVTGETVEAIQTPYIEFVQAEVTGTLDDRAAEVVSQFSDLSGPIVVVCAEGKSSAYVAERLQEAGVEATNLADGMQGWARVYVSEEIEIDADATVRQYQRPSSGCLAYLVVSGDEAAVIDPLRAFADRYVADAADLGATLQYAVDTHVHADHVSGVRDVAAVTDAKVVLPAGARERGFDYDATTVADGDGLRVGDVTLTARRAPGHTTEMTAFALDGVLFGGDLLFLESVARPDLEAGSEGAPDLARRLHRTLADRVLSLPDETLVAPGHYSERARPAEDGTYTATIGALRERLQALSMDVDAFVEYVMADMPPRPANYEEIVEANLGRRTVDDEEAFELELGPNNCAATTAAD